MGKKRWCRCSLSHPTGRPDYRGIGAMPDSGEMPGLGRALVRNKYLALTSEYLQQQVNIGLRVAALL